MCEICRPVLTRYAKPHSGVPCPLEKALYCPLCATYGHSPKRCREQGLRLARRQEAPVEDPIVEVTRAATESMWLEVADTEPAIRATLLANGVQPMICQEKGRKEQRDYHENKQRLRDLCAKTGMKLVLVTPPVATEGSVPTILPRSTPATTKSKRGSGHAAAPNITA